MGDLCLLWGIAFFAWGFITYGEGFCFHFLEGLVYSSSRVVLILKIKCYWSQKLDCEWFVLTDRSVLRKSPSIYFLWGDQLFRSIGQL